LGDVYHRTICELPPAVFEDWQRFAVCKGLAACVFRSEETEEEEADDGGDWDDWDAATAVQVVLLLRMYFSITEAELSGGGGRAGAS
jgi:hypothetical protein